MVGHDGRAAALAWLVSLALAIAAVGGLSADGFVRAFLPVSIALTTTTLGTLLPILRDAGENRGAFGKAMLANGAVGELFPIVAISLFLSGRGTWAALGLLLAFGVIAYVVSASRHGSAGALDQRAASAWVGDLLADGGPLRRAVHGRPVAGVGHLGLDAILGAFAGRDRAACRVAVRGSAAGA